MSDANSGRRVVVTAQSRPHPAVSKLARACIELARQRRTHSTAETAAPRRREVTDD